MLIYFVRINMLGVLNNHRMGTDSTFSDSTDLTTANRNIEETYYLRSLSDEQINVLLRDNCKACKPASFLSWTTIPVVVAHSLCFVTLEFGYDENGEIRLFMIEYTIADHNNTQVYGNKSVCSSQSAKDSRLNYKGKICLIKITTLLILSPCLCLYFWFMIR